LNPIAASVASHQQMNPRTSLLPRLAISALVATLLLPACDQFGIRGNGTITTDARSTVDFSTIEASGGYKISWAPGAPALSVTCDENLLDKITTTVTNGQLRIRTKERVRPTHGIKITLSSQALTGGKFRGAVDFKATKVSAPSFFIESDGASDVVLDGTADTVSARLRGAGDFNAQALQAKSVEISLLGAADAKVYATESLTASIKGAGDIRYSGNPQSIKKSIAGAGSVRPAK
jgi:hypothetical protein